MNWYLVFFGLLAGFLFVLIRTRDKKYLLYSIVGSCLGFYADYISFTFGYYSYPSFYVFTILGLPFSMTLAEGFATAITVYTAEIFQKLLKNISKARKTKNVSFKSIFSDLI